MSEAPKGFFDGNPKTMFTFGVVSGMAAILLFNSFAGITYGAGTGSGGGWFGGNDTDTAELAATAKVSAPVVQGKLAEVTDADHVRGDLSKAKVVIVEYSDFECPYCARHHPTLVDIMDDYGSDVAWVYRHFPLSFHPEAEPAALASECANEQGKFWEYADALVENHDKLGNAYYKSLAKELGMKTAQFNDCLDTAKYQDVVDADTASGRAAGVSGTPATFINGVLVAGSNGSSVGAAPKSTFTALIDAALEK
jgi:protein-disulfide isomerase